MLRFFSNILWTTVRRSGKIPTENLLVSMAVVISSWILIKATCINYVKERSNTEPCGRPNGAMAQRTEMSRNLHIVTQFSCSGRSCLRGRHYPGFHLAGCVSQSFSWFLHVLPSSRCALCGTTVWAFTTVLIDPSVDSEITGPSGWQASSQLLDRWGPTAVMINPPQQCL